MKLAPASMALASLRGRMCFGWWVSPRSLIRICNTTKGHTAQLGRAKWGAAEPQDGAAKELTLISARWRNCTSRPNNQISFRSLYLTKLTRASYGPGPC